MSADSDEEWKRAAIALSRRVWGCASCRSVNLDESDGSCPQCGQLMQEHDGATLIARWNTEDGMRAAGEVARLRAQVARLRDFIQYEHDSSHDKRPSIDCAVCDVLAEPAPEGQLPPETEGATKHAFHMQAHFPPEPASRLVPEAEWRALGELEFHARNFVAGYNQLKEWQADGRLGADAKNIDGALAAVEQARQEGREK